MEYDAPQSDSPIPYIVDRILRMGWPSTSDGHSKQSWYLANSLRIDDDSFGVFCLSFMDSIIRGLSIFNWITQAFVDKLRKDYAFEIFLNNTDPGEAVEFE